VASATGPAAPSSPGKLAEDAGVPAFWHDLGLPGLADIHVHFLPPRMLRRVWHYFDEAGPLLGRPWPIQYRWTDAERVAHLNSLGVRMFGALSYAHRPKMAEDLNDWALEFARHTPGCIPSGTFYPEPEVLDYVSRAIDGGAALFKVHLQVGGFPPDDPELEPVWGLLEEAAIPVVIHAGHAPVGTPYTGPEPLARLLTQFPTLTAVIAHMGAPDYEPFLTLAERHERVHLDTTMVFTSFWDSLSPFPPGLLSRVARLGLAGKILLGSDFPNIPYPYAEQLDGLARLGLGPDWLRAVCWHNPIRLMGPGFLAPGPGPGG
jgi:uncharacterized protein